MAGLNDNNVFNQNNYNPIGMTWSDGGLSPQNGATYWVQKGKLKAKTEYARLSLHASDNYVIPANIGTDKISMQLDIPLLDDNNINNQGINAIGKHIENGNLYGDSTDIGVIISNLPVLMGETHKRVNRVGISKTAVSATIWKFGFFMEFTADLLQFDKEGASYLADFRQKMGETAVRIDEDMLQIDILYAAGTLVYGGMAVTDQELDETCQLSYNLFETLSTALRKVNAYQSKQINKGSANANTKPMSAAYVAYVHPDAVQALKRLKDMHGNPALTPAHVYAAGTELMQNEIGQIDEFRICTYNNIMYWGGAGAPVSSDVNLKTTNGKADIYPILVIGEDAFSTVSFITSGGAVNKGSGQKFLFREKLPNSEITPEQPYGCTGLMSIQWRYGFMPIYPERIGLIKFTLPRYY